MFTPLTRLDHGSPKTLQFEGLRVGPWEADDVWWGLHDPSTLCQVIPGCTRLHPTGDNTFEATVEERVGPFTVAYGGTLRIDDAQENSLTVAVCATGSTGSLALQLQVRLINAEMAPGTSIGYVAHAVVDGMVGRLGTHALLRVGEHLTESFFRSLDAVLSEGVPARGTRA
jgi:uncharacterized protein